jgi:hypothetical protein
MKMGLTLTALDAAEASSLHPGVERRRASEFLRWT